MTHYQEVLDDSPTLFLLGVNTAPLSPCPHLCTQVSRNQDALTPEGVLIDHDTASQIIEVLEAVMTGRVGGPMAGDGEWGRYLPLVSSCLGNLDEAMDLAMQC